MPSFLLETKSQKEMESWSKKRGCLRVPVPSTVPSPGQQLLLCNEHPASNHLKWLMSPMRSTSVNSFQLCLSMSMFICLNCPPVAWSKIDPVMTLCVCCTSLSVSNGFHQSTWFTWFRPEVFGFVKRGHHDAVPALPGPAGGFHLRAAGVASSPPNRARDVSDWNFGIPHLYQNNIVTICYYNMLFISIYDHR